MWLLLLMIEIIYILMMLHIRLFLPCCQYHNLTKWRNCTFLVAMVLWKFLRKSFSINRSREWNKAQLAITRILSKNSSLSSNNLSHRLSSQCERKHPGRIWFGLIGKCRTCCKHHKLVWKGCGLLLRIDSVNGYILFTRMGTINWNSVNSTFINNKQQILATVTMISYPFCLFWFCFPKFLGRRGWNLRTQENSIDKKRIDVNNESMDETVKDTQYGFMGLQEKLETWTWTMAQKRNSSNTLLGEPIHY